MAHFFSFILIIFVSFLPLALSRSLSSPPHNSQILDVAKSIQNTLHVLSPKFQSFQHEAIKQPLFNPSFSSALSVSIYPRSSLTKTQHKNYTSLTLSRLARDSVRVSSLTTMLQLEEIQTSVTSGNSEGSGEYFARVGLGQPVKEFYMVIDTGSDITWLQCEPCSECYKQTDPIFNPSDSSTYTSLSCDSSECSALHVSECSSTGTCLYQVSYGDGSFTVGEFATETVLLGNSEGSSFSNVVIGCGHDNEGLFIGSAGLVALGGGTLSLPSQIKATSFSYCLVDLDSDSSSTLEFNSAGPSDSIIAPLLQNSKRSTFFYVGLEGISVAGEMLSVPANIFQVDDNGDGGIIVDSGTVVTRFERSVYNALRDTFVKYAQDLPADGDFMLFDTCYDLSGMTTASVPTVAFHFPGGKTLSLNPKNTLVPVNSSGKFCLAFAPEDGKFSIIGNIQQQGTRITYDLANNLVGFSPDKCERRQLWK